MEGQLSALSRASVKGLGGSLDNDCMRHLAGSNPAVARFHDTGASERSEQSELHVQDSAERVPKGMPDLAAAIKDTQRYPELTDTPATGSGREKLAWKLGAKRRLVACSSGVRSDYNLRETQ